MLYENVEYFCFHPLSDEFAVAYSKPVIKIFDRETNLKKELDFPLESRITVVKYSHSGTVLAAGGELGILYLFETENYTLQQ